MTGERERTHEEKLRELERRLAEARRQRQDGAGKRHDAHAKAHHLVLRLLADMGVALLAGVLLGWGADSYFGTRPWGVLAGALLGLAAGVRNVLHTADMAMRQRRMETEGGMTSLDGDDAKK